MLLDSIKQKEESKKKDVELEISWGVGLKQKAEELVKKKSKEDEIKKLTPWEERLTKQKEKRRQRKLGKQSVVATEKGSESSGSRDDDDDDSSLDQPFSDDEVDVDMNDPFFKQELKSRGQRVQGQRKQDKKLERPKTDAGTDEKSMVLLICNLCLLLMKVHKYYCLFINKCAGPTGPPPAGRRQSREESF